MLSIDRKESSNEIARFRLKDHRVKVRKYRQHLIGGEVREFPVGVEYDAGTIVTKNSWHAAYVNGLVHSGAQRVHTLLPAGDFKEEVDALNAIATNFDFSTAATRMLRANS